MNNSHRGWLKSYHPVLLISSYLFFEAETELFLESNLFGKSNELEFCDFFDIT